LFPELIRETTGKRGRYFFQRLTGHPAVRYRENRFHGTIASNEK